MHGLINRAIQGFVADTYGGDRWQAVANLAGVDAGGADALECYDDAVTERLVAATCGVLGRQRPGILEDLGTWLVARRQPPTIRRLLRFGGSGFADFLHSLPDLPGRARMAVDHMHLPAIELDEVAPGHFRIRLKGIGDFGHVLHGLLQAMADDYGALALIECTGTSPDGADLAVQVIQTDYAEGRGFSLGRAQE